MYIQKPTSGGDFSPPPAGTHLAGCYRVLDLGTQKSEYQGEVKFQRKILLSWEFPDEKMEDGQTFSIHKRYTLSFHEKANLRKDLESWRGKPFVDADFSGPPNGFSMIKLLGAPCLITVIHAEKDGKTYANISSISRIMKGMALPPLTNKQILVDLTDKSTFSMIEELSEGLQKTIKGSPEYQEAISGKADPLPSEGDYGMDPDDAIPF